MSNFPYKTNYYKFDLFEVSYLFDPKQQKPIEVIIRFYPVHKIEGGETFGWFGKCGATAYLSIDIPIPPTLADDKYLLGHVENIIHSLTKNFLLVKHYDEFGKIVREKVESVIIPYIKRFGENVVVDVWNFATTTAAEKLREILSSSERKIPVVFYSPYIGEGYVEMDGNMRTSYFPFNVQVTVFLPFTVTRHTYSEHNEIVRRFMNAFNRLKGMVEEIVIAAVTEFSETFYNFFVENLERRLRRIVPPTDEKTHDAITLLLKNTNYTLPTYNKWTVEDAIPITLSDGEMTTHKSITISFTLEPTHLPLIAKLMEERDEVKVLMSLATLMSIFTDHLTSGQKEFLEFVSYVKAERKGETTTP